MNRLICMTVLVALAGCAPTTPPGGLPPATPVFFEPWSAALDDHANAAISTAAQAALASPTSQVVVTGAADSTGGADANKYISETRAQQVADQLVTDGVPRERITVHGVGVVAAPTTTSGTPAQFSRRVLIQVEAPGSAAAW